MDPPGVYSLGPARIGLHCGTPGIAACNPRATRLGMVIRDVLTPDAYIIDQRGSGAEFIVCNFSGSAPTGATEEEFAIILSP